MAANLTMNRDTASALAQAFTHVRICPCPLGTKRMNRKPRTRQELQAAAEHVRYEIEELALLYGFSSPFSLPQAHENARIEATVIHLTNLVNFFWPNRPHEDDVLARDFGFDAALAQVGQALVRRRNKEVAHLTYTRAEKRPSKRLWDFDALVPPVLREARRFAHHMLVATDATDHAAHDAWKMLHNLIERACNTTGSHGTFCTASSRSASVQVAPPVELVITAESRTHIR